MERTREELVIAQTKHALDAFLQLGDVSAWDDRARCAEHLIHALGAFFKIHGNIHDNNRDEFPQLALAAGFATIDGDTIRLAPSHLIPILNARNRFVHARTMQTDLRRRTLFQTLETLVSAIETSLGLRIECCLPKTLWDRVQAYPPLARVFERIFRADSDGKYLDCLHCAGSLFHVDFQQCRRCLKEETIFVCSQHNGVAYARQRRLWLPKPVEQAVIDICGSCFDRNASRLEQRIKKAGLEGAFVPCLHCGRSTLCVPAERCYACGTYDSVTCEAHFARLNLVRCVGCNKPCEVDPDEYFENVYCGECITKWPICSCGHHEHPERIDTIDGKTLCEACASEFYFGGDDTDDDDMHFCPGSDWFDWNEAREDDDSSDVVEPDEEIYTNASRHRSRQLLEDYRLQAVGESSRANHAF